MAQDFLLEIGMEEMPAKFAPGAVSQLSTNAEKMLTELRLPYEGLKVYVTPRRLALSVQGLAGKQADLTEEAKGPALKAAYDTEGKTTKAAEGFARSQGVPVQDLFVKELNGVPYVYALKSLLGQETAALLPKFCQDLITSLHFPKPMRWGNLEVRFARPIRWLVALYGEEVIPFTYVELTAGRTTRGHRTLGGDVRLGGPRDYLEVLEKVYVLADQDLRRQRIWEQIQTLAKEVGGQPEADEDLLREVCHLVEYPTALMGTVEPDYMILPEEVITTPMKEHQRYFPLRDSQGKLLPYFITVRNGDRTALDLVRAGNQKVLKARLEDAAFYYREDLKSPLHTLLPKLDRVVYHEKQGTVGQRVTRLRLLAEEIGRAMGLDPQQMELLDRAALLAKADLVTHMVYDFPELQGIMGSYYAGQNGEAPEVCTSILEHYQPRYTGDAFPSSPIGQAVSMADKLDAIVGSFGIGIQPTGSQDPYALRRQALGIIGMLMEDSRDLSLTPLIRASYQIFARQGVSLEGLDSIQPALTEFFQQRIRFLLQEKGFRYDTVDAVMTQEGDRPYLLNQKARALTEIRQQTTFPAYLNAYTRCMNLSKKAAEGAWQKECLVDPSEIALYQGLQACQAALGQALGQLQYNQAYQITSDLVPLIEKLFDAVMIMVEDEALRHARLGLLRDCAQSLSCVGELSLLAQ